MNLKNKIHKIKGKVFVWPGDAGWHFVGLDKKTSSEIKQKYKNKIYGAGFIKIKASIGKSIWTTALFPYKTQEIYLLSIKKQIRKKEGVFQGDHLNIVFEIL